MVLWYFEEDDVVLCRGSFGTLKRVMWYFEEGDVVLFRGSCGTLKRVLLYVYVLCKPKTVIVQCLFRLMII